ncbi:pseudouridine synthase [Pelagibaculum spongiae]|uniref:Pseudouridine synthase n=1 Tax=Pelagibaculum spongiae TaxID=2080658 RepID=A0A2V1GXD9_9GAMM|nr:pseudouridine synthase [Pelagibaculum spongiae]PVZ71764.1 pseudouridine synthase [Pelagibaculum spongiae]
MKSSVRAAQASSVVLPETVTDQPTVFGFLTSHFPQIGADVWRQRILDGKVHWHDGQLISLDSQFVPRQRVYYYREVAKESLIPFEEKLLFQNDHILLVYKPHFLAVNPSGNFVNECLVNRLRLKLDNPNIVASHRLDRATAGIMLLCKQPENRHLYHELFKQRKISKTYQAIATLSSPLQQLEQGQLAVPQNWSVRNHIAKATPSFMRHVIDGEANSHSEISLIEVNNNLGLFELEPVTGKTHQLRLHMMSLGMPIHNDRLYPQLLDKAADDFENPLKLLAKRLRFTDPITQQKIDVSCEGLNF